jgi:hypothetical protein
MTGLLPLAHAGEPGNMSRLNQAEILVVKRGRIFNNPTRLSRSGNPYIWSRCG